jgi:DnaJ-class molecular chaperone
MGKDFYLVLEVTPEASPALIHSAYRHRALELQPGRSGAGSKPFMQLQEAYSVLGDPALRAAYDRETNPGGMASSSPAAAEPFKEAQPASGLCEISLSQSFDTFNPSFDEIFDRLRGNFELHSRPKAERAESLTIDVPLSPEDALTGGSVRILVPARVTCSTCHGRGGLGFYECWHCHGQGAVVSEYPLDVPYPAGLGQDYIARVPLNEFGIQNLYLTARFRLSDFA